MISTVCQRFLMVLLLGLKTLGLSAQQVVYYENFQAADFPADILLVNYDRQVPLPPPMGKSTDAWIRGYHHGDPSRTFAMTSSRFGTGVQADRWMILPLVRVPENPVLRWQVRSSAINPQNWEDYQVLVSESGTDTDGFRLVYEERATYSDTSFEAFTPWTQKELDLSDFSGKDIHIAFRAAGTDGFLLFIDEISVSGLSSLSFALDRVSAPKYNDPGNVRIEGALLNTGRDQIHSFDVRLENLRGQVLASSSFTGLAIGSNQTFDFEFPVLNLADAGIHTIRCVVKNPNSGQQAERARHAREVEVVVIRESASKQVLAELYTGTWCGHCPKGVLTMKRLIEAYPDVIIPAFVHHRDGFAIDEADSLIMFMPNGYPSATFDRFNIERGVRPAITSYTDNSWKRALKRRLNSPTPAEVHLTHSFDPQTRELSVQVGVRFVAETFGDLRVNLMITEDDVRSSVYDQLNFANADPNWPELNQLGNPIPDYRHDYVVRRIFDGPWGLPGQIPFHPPVNEMLTFQYSMPVPADWKANDIQLIAYVSEHHDPVHRTEVLNTTRVKMTDEGTALQVSELEAFYAETAPGDQSPAPDFTVEDIHGNSVSFSDFLGKVVYIDFWATWCAPCRAEIPHLNRLKEELKEHDDIVVIGLSTDAITAKDRWKEMVREMNMGDVQLFAGEKAREIMDAYIVRSIPHFTIINKDGTIYKNMTVRPSNPLTKQILLDLAK